MKAKISHTGTGHSLRSKKKIRTDNDHDDDDGYALGLKWRSSSKNRPLTERYSALESGVPISPSDTNWELWCLSYPIELGYPSGFASNRLTESIVIDGAQCVLWIIHSVVQWFWCSLPCPRRVRIMRYAILQVRALLCWRKRHLPLRKLQQRSVSCGILPAKLCDLYAELSFYLRQPVRWLSVILLASDVRSQRWQRSRSNWLLDL